MVLEGFFNLISEQLRIQPPTITDPELVKQNPNRGRKVLMFSDSRQRAAVLAKEFTEAADEDASDKDAVESASTEETAAEGAAESASTGVTADMAALHDN